MGLTNIRASRRLERQRAAKGLSEINPPSDGWTSHAKDRAEKRVVSLSEFPISLRTLNGIIREGRARVERAKGGANRVTLFVSGVSYEIIADMRGRKIRKEGIITICRSSN